MLETEKNYLLCMQKKTLYNHEIDDHDILQHLKTKVNFKTPSMTTLKSLSDADSVINTSAPINGAEFNHASFIVLPPFIAKTFLSSSTRSADKLVIETISSIASFDNDSEESIKASNKASDLEISLLVAPKS